MILVDDKMFCWSSMVVVFANLHSSDTLKKINNFVCFSYVCRSIKTFGPDVALLKRNQGQYRIISKDLFSFFH